MEFERSCVDGVPVFWTESGDGTATAALLVFGLILGVSAASFARARLLIRAAQQNPRKY